ncbi:hypothetical protein Poli38472_008792 [Pythium oligandrum]|uniref:glucan endo-1,3-beta-D-glucosidase n=1 Tax=Pythium oligandrum TaxID=41045 RepID=A0A8K1FCS9_PYTOL|nr:hypothetical protein Poli38472_008792 [Pythium oligandrum]|eukprot:TMW56144.1 hypothetical protein Poli38472_008792 [Pythium oligandrum]
MRFAEFLVTLVTISTAVAWVDAQNITSFTPSRRLAGVGNIAVCYSPFHNAEYPLTGGGVDVNKLRAAIEADFQFLSKYVTHVRTYYSMHYGIEVAPIAAKYGLKLYLGVFLTSESWSVDETNAAVNAVVKYPGTVEAVLVGNENLAGNHGATSQILSMVNEIRSRVGSAVNQVKWGTVQRITEYLDSSYDNDIWTLEKNLDILGVNIYPFFNNVYNGNNPTKLLDDQWNAVSSKYTRSKLRLTETGFPTAGAPSSLSPNVWPSLDSSVKYYEALVNWQPSGAESMPKFWFQAFDRHPEDPMSAVECEQYFGFFYTNRQSKRDDFPRQIGSSLPPISPSPVSTSPAPSSWCGVQANVDYSGNDIGSAFSSTAQGCVGICRSFSGCGAYTWTSYGGGTCWLKSGRGSSVANTGATSGIPCSCGLQSSVDYIGYDIGDAYSPNPDGCIAICRGWAGCGAFSWNSYDGGRCWLKSGRDGSTSVSGVTSGSTC